MPFDLQPTLHGALVTLRPLRAEDFSELYAVASDPLVWEQHPASDRHERPIFEGFFSEAMASKGALLICDNRDERVIGSSRYFGYDAERSEVEIGWTFLARSYWGGDYNREVKHLMLRHAFGFVDNVVFLIGPLNMRSRRAIEKIGGVLAGTRSGGSRRTSLVYRITAAAFAIESPRGSSRQ